MILAGQAPGATLPYPHARNDCALCRERDADLRLFDVPDTRGSSLLLCTACLGTHLTVLAMHQSGPRRDQPITVLIEMIERQHVLDSAVPPHPRCTRLDGAAGLAYPHRHDDCHDCRGADADLVLHDLAGRPALCRRCAAWNIAGRAALAPDTGNPVTTTVSIAPGK
uniref:hypothetical protein n=1 Tax=Amycolatopsis sp. CA-096443 TaxID=3239919 RepID=UPI003F49573A